MLASDVNNPDFVNPVNPDSLMSAEFFIWDKPDPVDAEGKKLTDFEGKPFVRIQSPGARDFVEQCVREDHKRRFPAQWKAFEAANGKGPAVGTPMEAWYEARKNIDLDETQLQLLLILKFHSVEALANASDHQVQRIGMAGQSLRTKAAEWLKANRQVGARDNEEAMRLQLQENQRQMDEMRAMLAQALSDIPKKPGRKPGRPAKQGVTAHGQHAPATGDAGHI